jgi:hypothetical protein
VFLTFIHVPDDGLAKPKHVINWHNLEENGIVCKQIHAVVCQTVFITVLVNRLHLLIEKVNSLR